MKQWYKYFVTMIIICTSCVVCLPGSVYARAKETGTYPARPGTILVTPDNQNKIARVFKLGHAGMVLNKSTVVEATLPHVTTAKNNWKSRAQVKRLYAVTVKNVSAAQRTRVANWCRKQVGKAYNKNYTNVATRRKFYCSHLVWAGYKDLCRIDLNTNLYGRMIAPVELINSPRTSLVYSYVR